MIDFVILVVGEIVEVDTGAVVDAINGAFVVGVPILVVSNFVEVVLLVVPVVFARRCRTLRVSVTKGKLYCCSRVGEVHGLTAIIAHRSASFWTRLSQFVGQRL